MTNQSSATFPDPSTGELRPSEVREAVALLLRDDVQDPSKANFLEALQQRKETPREITEFTRALLDLSVEVGIDPKSLSGPLIDVCGTGGDRLDLFNVSTTVAFVVAAGGAAVAKHGNRGVSSKSGGANVLEALGVSIHDTPEQACARLEAHGFCFLYAPEYHPAFRSIASVRKSLGDRGSRTIFNLLGPLLNPARPTHQFSGVFLPDYPTVFTHVLAELGRISTWVVHGIVEGQFGANAEPRGMDEISTLGPTFVSTYKSGTFTEYVVNPIDAGLTAAKSVATLRGGDAEQNAKIIYGILSGEIIGDPLDLVLINAGGAFCAAGLSNSLKEGVEFSRQLIRDRSALQKLQSLQ